MLPGTSNGPLRETGRPRFALAHHWIASYRGGERVVEQIAHLFPDCDLYTLINDPQVTVPGLSGHAIHASVLNRVPAIRRIYRHLLPFHPWAIHRMRVPHEIDVLLSSDSSLIKGIRVGPHTRHVCYCHSPPRYLWEMAKEYKRASWAASFALDRVSERLRRFDFAAAQRVDHFIANSHFVAGRIKRYYQRDAQVVYPPASVDAFEAKPNRQPYHVVVSELVSYKRVDLAVDAYTRLGRRLLVIGDGPERARLQRRAGSTVRFLGRQSFAVLRQHLESAAAFVFPGIEDFGIAPVEAQAAGCPVIAFRAGGALETVIDGETGLFFDDQTVDSLTESVERFDRGSYSYQTCRRNAERFSVERFRQAYGSTLERCLGQRLFPNEQPTFARRA